MYHWVITVQYTSLDGSTTTTQTLHGTTTAACRTRQEAFHAIRSTCAGRGVPEDASVLFFSYEPNTL